MVTVMLSRAGLWWSLSAVLPHCKDSIGLSLDSASMTVWGTDNYTVGIARVDAPQEEPTTAFLSAKEGLAAMRWLRPSRKAEETQTVRVLTLDDELHLGIYDREDVAEFPFTLADTAVFKQLDDVRSTATHLPFLRDWLARTYDAPAADEMVYQGPLLTRFDKAVIRGSMDRVRFYPRTYDPRHGVALVTVGDNFIGAISALTYDKVDAVDRWLTGINAHEQLELW